ncbi:MAG TPA: peptidoglycan-binding domain-containing protein [Crenalkalicoccus sp.]|nr:peptidoglycan-binding domain-containing protein [Crenalkalicoccus sp.]
MRRIAMALGAGLVLGPGLAGAQAPQPPLYTQPLSTQSVELVQRQLRQAGAYSGRVDGIWGADSQTALEQFQQRHGLQVTGQLNQATAATLGLQPSQLLGSVATGANAGPLPAVSGPLSPIAVRNVQEQLRALGFYRGTPDGVMGPGTQQALQRFQQGRGLQPTGQLNPPTVSALGLDPNRLEAPVR